MNSDKQCKYGAECKNQQKKGDGWLPVDCFPTMKTGALRAYRTTCESFYDYTYEGAIEKWKVKNGGQNPPVMAKKDPETYSTLEVAILFQISTGGVRTLANSAKTTPHLESANLETQESRFSPKAVLRYQRDHGSLIDRARRNAEKHRVKLTAPLDSVTVASPIVPLVEYTQQSFPPGVTGSIEADDIIRDLVSSIQAFFVTSAMGFGVSINDFIECAASPIMANAVKRAQRYLNSDGEADDE